MGRWVMMRTRAQRSKRPAQPWPTGGIEPAFPPFRFYQGASREQAGFGPRAIRRGGGGLRFLGPVHALPATPARAVGEGLRLGGRCRRDVVLEPLSRGSL